MDSTNTRTRTVLIDLNKPKFIIAVDVGTTQLRCHIYDEQANIVGSSSRKIELLYPEPGSAEMDPIQLWDDFKSAIKEAIEDSKLSVEEMACIGISTQRGTFLTWNKFTGMPYHNFITWKDLRADQLATQWNKSWTMQSLRLGSKLLYTLSRQKRFLAASVLEFHTRQALIRLSWVLENSSKIRSAAENGELIFGMIDTWLLWKLTDGKVHATDYSCASSTAMFDPFLMDWGNWALKLFNIPSSILPEIKDTSGFFGSCDPRLFGASIPVTAIVGDQQAAMFGECCFHLGDVKCTMGTGSFLDVNTGCSPHASVAGLYPLVGWKIRNETTYIAEGISNDTGTSINWLQSIGLLDEPIKCSEVAKSVKSSGGVYFVPAFSGLQAPESDNSACAGFLGISPNTKREHLVRAVLESLAFRIKQLYDIMQQEVTYQLAHLRADGGVANCDFIIQLLSDLTSCPIDRPVNTETSSLGAAFLAGLAKGVWKSKEEITRLRKSSKVFMPQTQLTSTEFSEWRRAVKRCIQWYQTSSP